MTNTGTKIGRSVTALVLCLLPFSLIGLLEAKTPPKEMSAVCGRRPPNASNDSFPWLFRVFAVYSVLAAMVSALNVSDVYVASNLTWSYFSQSGGVYRSVVVLFLNATAGMKQAAMRDF